MMHDHMNFKIDASWFLKEASFLINKQYADVLDLPPHPGSAGNSNIG
jgi:hypothetical protein